MVNEVYSEIVNDVGEPRGKGNGKGPQKDGHVRFWVELLNPTSPTTGAFDGTVQLRYPASHSPYQLVIARAARKQGAATVDGAAYLTDPKNTTGDLAPGYTPEITYTFSNPDIETDGNKQKVAPNNGTPNPAGLPSNGIALVGPKVTGAVPAQEFDPLNNGMPAAPWTRMIEAPAANGNANGQDAMEYLVTPNDLNTAKPNNANSEFRRHVVLLRRLANPYVGPGPTNPYITVDTMDYVPANDGIFTGGPGGAGGGTAMNERFAIGKVQPYAVRSAQEMIPMGMNGAPTYKFPNSMVLAQAPSTPPGANDPKHTFGRHNYTGGGTGAGGTPSKSTYAAGPTLTDPNSGMAETLMAPFDWLVHMDRPLVNAVEAFQVRDAPSHRVTDQFVLGGGPAGVTYETGVGNWTSTFGLTRALEYLTVKPFTAGVPHGGRVPGRIAVNAIPDQRVINGLFDPQAGNGFNQGYVDSEVWQKWMGSRGTMQPRTLPDGTTPPYQVPAPNSMLNPTPTPTTPLYLPAPSTTDRPDPRPDFRRGRGQAVLLARRPGRDRRPGLLRLRRGRGPGADDPPPRPQYPEAAAVHDHRYQRRAALLGQPAGRAVVLRRPSRCGRCSTT